ncbi:hypothetical protein C8R43DRAFT_306260 [Mycena crocata]|nr:hypothetical protein C8R43DRAFT_306260 [Mycena crocata]
MRNWASDDAHADHVTEQIVKKSNGMFRMAACLLIELRKCYWGNTWEKILTAIPADLFGIYRRFLTRAMETLPAVLIQSIFRWLVFAARLVTLDELADAIAFRFDAPPFDLCDPVKCVYDPTTRRGNSDGLELLEGLIVIKSDRPSLAHSSVKDYILSLEFQEEFDAMIVITKEVSHKYITQTCIRSLQLFADAYHSMAEDKPPDYPVAEYAAEYWFYHLRLCNDRDQEVLLPSTMHLLNDGSTQYAVLYQLRQRNPFMFVISGTPLHMCSEIGYTAGVRSLLLASGPSLDHVNKDGWSAQRRFISR